jgi:TolA-binding protein
VAGAGKRSTWSDEVAAGDYASVVIDAERRGLAAVMADGTLADLVALADAARLSGRIDLARRTLLAQRSRFTRTSAAKDAAFFLGRIADDHERALDSATGWYDTYLSEAPAGHFAAEAFGRKMVAVSKLSGRSAAKATAGEYLRRFPSGPHAALARELVNQ